MGGGTCERFRPVRGVAIVFVAQRCETGIRPHPDNNDIGTCAREHGEPKFPVLFGNSYFITAVETKGPGKGRSRVGQSVLQYVMLREIKTFTCRIVGVFISAG